MSAPNALTIAQAVQRWAVRESGLPGNRVILEDQGKAQPAERPYITVKVLALPRVGWDQQGPTRERVEVQVAEVQPVADYTVTVDGVDLTITSGAAPTAQAILEALAAAAALGGGAWDDVELEDATLSFLFSGGLHTLSVSANLTVSDHYGEREVLGNRDVSCSVTVVGGTDPLGLAAQLQSSLQLESVLEELEDDGDLAFRGDLGLVDATIPMETAYDRRATLDLLFGSYSSVWERVGYINQIEITGQQQTDLIGG